MSVEEIKKGLAALSLAQQNEITAFLFHLRHSRAQDYEATISQRLSDSDKSHWLSAAEFEQRLDNS